MNTHFTGLLNGKWNYTFNNLRTDLQQKLFFWEGGDGGSFMFVLKVDANTCSVFVHMPPIASYNI